MPSTNLSQWQKHVIRWKGCTACDACHRRKNVVLLRGSVPCDVLFVGESPGLSEDSRGIPFHGPAGKEMDAILNEAMRCTKCGYNAKDYSIHMDHNLCENREDGGSIPTYALTNLVACIPDKDERGKLTDPTLESIDACRPRLLEIIGICQPRILVAVGKLAAKYLRYDGPAHVIEVTHPSAILQADLSQQGLMKKRVVVALRDAVEEFL